MKKYFVASLCKNGLLGGGITVDAEAVTFHTGKLTVPKEYRHLSLRCDTIGGATAGWLLVFPTVSVQLQNGEEYRFVIFRRKKFIETLKENIAGV
ncbi:MAG: hypothetical protein IKU17_10870 [Clostridia bacterium]|nr:hypothetical protein [Clostridia bacterium]